MKKTRAFIVLFIFISADAFPFGAEGHRTIAAIAAQLLSEKAKAATAEILEGETLIDASVWPDEIKPPFGAKAKTPEAHVFNHAHADNKKWHYVNFPLGSTTYSASSKFAYDHDIVHIIAGCITVLEGGTFENLTQKEALRYIVHLVGDIHQPLHTVAGFFDYTDREHPKIDKTITQPNDDISDSGGNLLFYSKKDELHACWDTILVNDVFATKDPNELAQHVMQGAPSPEAYRTTGKYQTWAAAWAGDSMRQAASAYADVEFGEATVDGHGHLKAIAITLKPSTQAYRTKNAAVIKEQLRKGGVHLAQLLNSISWSNAK